MWSYYLLPVFFYASHELLSKHWYHLSGLKLYIASFALSYLPTYLQTTPCCFKDGLKLSWLQKHWIWKYLVKITFKDSSVSVEEKLDPNQLYIFCSFPHGACSINHILTMSDCHRMLTEHYPAERRDLAATVLFLMPFAKDVYDL